VGDVRLPGLLGRALGDLTAEFVAAGAGRDGVPSAPMWFGILRTIPTDGDVAYRDLPALSRLSKRAVRQLVGAAQRAGWIEVVRGTTAQGTIRLSPSGGRAAATWAALVDETERRWSKRVGAEPERLHAALAALVGRLDLELPHYPLSYGSADFSVTGGTFRPSQAGPPRIPAHGQDWSPVVREEGDTGSALTLTPLLSQLVVAFAIDYAEGGTHPFVVVDALVRGFGTNNTVPVKALPAVLGVTGGGKSGLERHGVIAVRPDPTDKRLKLAHLLATGQEARDNHAELVSTIDSGWEARFGSASVAALRDALERMSLDPVLPDAVMATYVQS
jgi:hypothetical protein